MLNRICAVVVTYNRLSLLKESIAAIKSQNYGCDIFVIDNHSEDSTCQYLEKEGIQYYSCNENIGGAGGFSVGIRKAYEMGYEFIWLMDDDCIPEKDALEKLMQADKMLDGEYGFLSSRALWVDGTDHSMNKPNHKEKYYDALYYVKQATFVSLLLKREVIKKVGLPIKEFFIWGDDIEYTRRIAVNNMMDSYYVENSIVIHKTDTNVGSKIAFDEIGRIDRYRFAYRNELYLYSKEGIGGLIYYYCKCFYNALRIVLLSKNNKKKRLAVMLTGMREGLTFAPEIETV